MWALILTAVAVVAGVNGGQLYASAPQDRGQYHRTSGGVYNYGYNTGDGTAKVEVKRKDGSVVGSYRYFDPNGKQIVRSYVADSKGFRILGNDLPISPETPAAAIVGAPALTASVEGAAQQVVDAAQHPTKPQNTVDINSITSQPLLRHYQQQQVVFQQQNDLLQKQQRMIEQQQRQLDELASRQSSHLSSNLRDTLTPESVQYNKLSANPVQYNAIPTNAVQFNTIENEVSAGNTPYYYYPYKYDYDFPAGFAHSGGVVQVVEQPKTTVVGLQRAEEEPNVITAGHRAPVEPKPRLVIIKRNRLPRRRSYVIGRT